MLKVCCEHDLQRLMLQHRLWDRGGVRWKAPRFSESVAAAERWVDLSKLVDSYLDWVIWQSVEETSSPENPADNNLITNLPLIYRSFNTQLEDMSVYWFRLIQFKASLIHRSAVDWRLITSWNISLCFELIVTHEMYPHGSTWVRHQTSTQTSYMICLLCLLCSESTRG